MKNEKMVKDELSRIRHMTGMDNIDIIESLDASHMGFRRFLDIADVHRLRTESMLSCSNCEFKNVCMKKPMVRIMLLNYMEKDISSIEGKGFYYL